LRWWWIIISIVVWSWAGGLQAEDCLRCHPQKNEGFFQHAPYRDRRCGVCHLRVEFQEKGTVEVDEKEVRWWRRVRFRGGELYLPLPPHRSSWPVVVKGPESTRLLSPEQAEEIEDLPPPPRLQRAYVCDMVRGVTVSVKLCLETTSPAEVEVKCPGTEAFSEGLATRHALWLEGLKAGFYHCKVWLRGLEGEKKAFEISVNTREISPPPERHGKPVLSEVSLRRVVGRPYLYLRGEFPVTLRLGFLPVSPSREARQGEGKAHEGLRPLREVATAVCYRCHEAHTLGVTHPVDVVYRPGKIVKPVAGLPLFDNRVACASCHGGHEARWPHLLRRRGRDLCLACHLEKYFR